MGDAHKAMRMTMACREQYLRPEGLYALNRVLEEIQDQLQNKAGMRGNELIVVPVLFNKQTRTFHQACVLGLGWGPRTKGDGFEQEFLPSIIDFLWKVATDQDFGQAFDQAAANVLKEPSYSESITELMSYVNSIRKISNLGATEKNKFTESLVSSQQSQKNLIQWLHLLYFGFKSHRYLYISGILFRGLEAHAKNYRVEYFKGDVFERDDDEIPVKYKGNFYPDSEEDEAIEEEPGIYSQVEFSDIQKELSVKQEEQVARRGATILIDLLKIFYANVITAQEKKAKKEGQQCARLDGPILLLPIYDVWLGGRGFGGIWGCLICTFAEGVDRGRAPREVFLKQTLPEFLPRCEALADELFEAGLAAIVDEGVQAPYDLAEHFVRLLAHVQDWDRVSVRRRHGGARQTEYCFRRQLPVDAGASGDYAWVRCDPRDCSTCLSEGGSSRILTWDETLWHNDLIPELTPEEMTLYKDVSFEFLYPDTAYIPRNCHADDRIFEHFENALIRQQIEVLRLLIPRVREKRYALRTAATAIMGRNMSHNIGSHVLARYATKIKDDTASERKKTDHRGAFLAYLQRRMDFLAEIATSNQSFWFQPLSLKEQIDRLNYEKEKERYAKTAEPILLSYITGKDTKANVEYQPAVSDGDVWFSCPGGEIGVHALFVILENIIRNSARHGADGAEPVELIARFDERGSTTELLKVEIIDRRSRIHVPGGEKLPLHESINNIINNEPLLDAMGNPNPRNWGVREMQICAHYLRGFALSDLQGGRAIPPVLEAGSDCSDHRSCLKYTIYLRRAKLMAAIVRDDSEYQKAEAQLRQKGVLVVPAPAANGSSERLGERVKEYSFVAVESGIEVGTPGNDIDMAACPVRTLPLCRKEIDEVLSKALGGDQGLAWMELLHQRWAETVQGGHPAWQDKQLWGLAVEGTEALKTLSPGGGIASTLKDDQQGGLFRVLKGSSQCRISPLPDEAENWWRTLYNDAAAAAWVDHLREPFLGAAGAGLAQAYKQYLDGKLNWISVEDAVSDSPHSVYLNAVPDGGGWEIIAAALPRVAVLDERVQSELATKARSGIPLSTIWPCMGVWVPARVPCNLNAPTFGLCHAFLENPPVREDQLPIDFLIIHLTVLEGLAKELGLPPNATLTHLINETQAVKAEVIVVSGRGVPKDHAIEGIRFLPISALLESLVLRPSKLTLMRSIWSAGRPGAATYT